MKRFYVIAWLVCLSSLFVLQASAQTANQTTRMYNKWFPWAHAQMTKNRAIVIANGFAEQSGYRLADYHAPKAEYQINDEHMDLSGNWLLIYKPKVPVLPAGRSSGIVSKTNFLEILVFCKTGDAGVVMDPRPPNHPWAHKEMTKHKAVFIANHFAAQSGYRLSDYLMPEAKEVGGDWWLEYDPKIPLYETNRLNGVVSVTNWFDIAVDAKTGKAQNVEIIRNPSGL